MQIGNREALDQARNDLRDQFDAIWMFTEAFGPRERRAVRCAMRLDEANYIGSRGNSQIYPWGRSTRWPNVIRG